MTKDEARQIAELGMQHPIVKIVLRLDREVGCIKGELRWIRIGTVATFGVVVTNIVARLF